LAVLKYYRVNNSVDNTGKNMRLNTSPPFRQGLRDRSLGSLPASTPQSWQTMRVSLTTLSMIPIGHRQLAASC